ncbi:hypothetical protein ADK75_30200 [Streptomyces virginiae]|uniref:Uncharacterized protein n=1 Tax=Streptomyces virginiae TaxID=1961 RepID=A0A0L8M5Q8_STRVG|nr:hypothetical protein [Streptomyces virginiae]KOG45728.1 hypothetical protein ADK75_30200 [Streptomyces virginiae]
MGHTSARCFSAFAASAWYLMTCWSASSRRWCWRTPQTPEPLAALAAREPGPGTRRVADTAVLVALLATCAGLYLPVGEAGFAGVISVVAALYGTWRVRR